MHVDRFPAEQSTLAEHLAELRSRCAAISRLQGSPTYYREDIEIFRTYGKEKNLYLSKESFRELASAPDEEGNEHQVWYLADQGRYLKITWPDFFGLNVIYTSEQDQFASHFRYNLANHEAR